MSSKFLPQPYHLWLATTDYNTALPPSKREDGTDRMATEPSVSATPSDFLGQSLVSLAKTLKNAPKEVYLNRQYFAVLDKQYESDELVTLCWIEGKDDDVKSVDTVRYEAKNVALYLNGLAVGTNMWSELKDNAPGK